MSYTRTVDLTEQFLPVLRTHLRFLEEEDVLPLDTDLKNLGLDSISAINLLLDLEQSFGVVVPDSMLNEETFRTATTLETAFRELIESSAHDSNQ